MKDRKEFINAILTGDVKKLRELRVKGNPVLISPCKGKYYRSVDRINEHGCYDVEISLAEIEELKKDHDVIFFIEVEPPPGTHGTATSEEEVVKWMLEDGDITDEQAIKDGYGHLVDEIKSKGNTYKKIGKK